MRRAYLIALLTLPCQLLAESNLNQADEYIFTDELPVVLSASRLVQPLSEAPAAMTVIDREMIEASGARNVPELLRLVPGFQVGYFDGNSPVVTYHGHGDQYSRRVQVLIDGRSIYVPALAAIQWSDEIINLDEIERIEVTRGPNAAAYGNNAYLATINIITRYAIETQGHKATVITGSHETNELNYRFGGQSGNTDYRVTVGKHKDDGTDDLNDYTRANYLSYRVDHRVDDQNQLFYQGGIKDNKLGAHEPTPDNENTVTSGFQWLKWEHISPEDNITSLQYYYNYNNNDITNENGMVSFSSFPTIDPFPDAPIKILSERHDVEYSHTHHFEHLRLVSGLSARLDIVSAQNVFTNDDTQYFELYRAFSHGEYRVTPDTLLNAGVMIEDNDISGTDIAPRLAIIHHINENHSVRLSISRATRTPTLYDQNAYFHINQQLTENGGNPLNPTYQALLGGTDILNLVDLISPEDIDSEKIESVEVGYIAQLINKKLLLDTKFFNDNTDKLIAISDSALPAPTDNLDGTADWVLNAFKTKLQGMELALDYKPSRSTRLYGYYAYIQIDAEMYDPRGNTRDIRRFEVSAPANSYGLMLIEHFDQDIDLGMTYFHVDDMDWMDRTGSTDAYYRDRSAQPFNKLDIKISKNQKYGTNELYYALTLQNLLEDYYDYNKTRYTDATMTTVAANNSTNMNGSLQDRRIYLELSLSFN